MNEPASIPNRMRAFVLTGHGDFDQLEYHDDWPTPAPGAGEVLIKVHACGLNNTDINTRTGWYSKGVAERTTGAALETADADDAGWSRVPFSFPRIQGADVAGTVVALGVGANQALFGQRVLVDPWVRNWDHPEDLDQCGYLGSEQDGGFADYVAVDSQNVHPVDCTLSHAELATFACSYVTAENMLNRAGVSRSDHVLITGASGGVGSALIQLANRRGATTVALASVAKHAAVAAAGAQVVLPRAPADLKAALHEAIGRADVEVVADVVGGEAFPQLIDVLARRGRYTCSGAIAGPIVPLDLRTLYLSDLTFTGATVVPPGVFANLAGYIERGEIKPLLAATYPLNQLCEAQQAFIDKRHVGNIVVSL